MNVLFYYINVKMTPISHLLIETKILPAKDHCPMLSKQFLLATQKQEHRNKINIQEGKGRGTGRGREKEGGWEGEGKR